MDGRLHDRNVSIVTATAAGRPVWERDGHDWPHRQTSRFVQAAGLLWHVQVQGDGPVVLLVHGTGAATHSWRDLAPLLAERFTTVAVDLPGHGFTGMPQARGLSLPGMAAGLAELLRVLDLRPALAVGHSAGAAIVARMTLDGLIAPHGLVSLNGALLPLSGLAGQIFLPMAKVLASTSLASRLFARRAADKTVLDRLLGGTGSTVDAFGAELYGRLARNPGHVAGALGMMANWDLRALERDLRQLHVPLVLVAGGRDRMVSPAQTLRLRRLLPEASVVRLPELGHLAHEERPDEIAGIVTRLARDTGVPAYS